jgi:hypothetical protein
VSAIIEQIMCADVPPSEQKLSIRGMQKESVEDLQLIPNTLFIWCMRILACYSLIASPMVVKTARYVFDALMSAIRCI